MEKSAAPEEKLDSVPAGTQQIQVNLQQIGQLFNSMDPSPFNEKDLDREAEEFILSWALEYPLHQPLSLHVHLEQWPDHDPGSIVREAIHHYFNYRAEMSQMEFRQLMSQGRMTLVIGLVFLAICFFAKYYLDQNVHAHWADYMKESLTIAGWVAMWKPMQIYLYDWWPALRRKRVYVKLGKMAVIVSGKNLESSR